MTAGAHSESWDDEYWREALLFSVLTLLCLSIVMALSIDGPELGLYGALRAKALRLVPGLLALFIAIRVPLQKLRRLILPCFWISVLLCLVPLFQAHEVKGAVRWIRIFGASFQPVELLKPLCVFATAEVLDRRRDSIDSFWHGVGPALMIPASAAGALLMQPDVGHAFFVLVIGGGMLLIGGMRIRHSLGLGLGMAAVAGLVLWFVFPHTRNRIHEYLSAKPGFQIGLALDAVANGGIWGSGVGSGMFQHVPEARNDFVLAVLGNEFGLIGSLLVLFCFVLLFVAAVKISIRSESRWTLLIGFGLAIMLVIQASLNMLGVTYTIPEKGIDLPFLSSGGTNLVFALASIGILVNISNDSGRESDEDIGG